MHGIPVVTRPSCHLPGSFQMQCPPSNTQERLQVAAPLKGVAAPPSLARRGPLPAGRPASQQTLWQARARPVRAQPPTSAACLGNAPCVVADTAKQSAEHAPPRAGCSVLRESDSSAVAACVPASAAVSTAPAADVAALRDCLQTVCTPAALALLNAAADSSIVAEVVELSARRSVCGGAATADACAAKAAPCGAAALALPPPPPRALPRRAGSGAAQPAVRVVCACAWMQPSMKALTLLALALAACALTVAADRGCAPQRPGRLHRWLQGSQKCVSLEAVPSRSDIAAALLHDV